MSGVVPLSSSPSQLRSGAITRCLSRSLRNSSRMRESETDATPTLLSQRSASASLIQYHTRNRMRSNPSLSLTQPLPDKTRTRSPPSTPSPSITPVIDHSPPSDNIIHSPPIPSPSSSPVEEKKEENNVDTHVSSVSSVSPPSPSGSFYSMPPTWKQIPARARQSFVSAIIRPILIQYSQAQSEGDIGKCNRLLAQFLDIPRIYLTVGTNNKPHRRRNDPVDKFIHQLNHHNINYRNNWQPIQEEKRVVDNDRKAVKRAIALIKMGDMKRAVKTLSNSTDIADINDDTIAQLKSLHPPQSEPLPPSPPSNAPKIIVNRKQLSNIIHRKLNNGAAGGPSGWTGKLFQPLTIDRECMEGLAAIIQDICNGEIADPIIRNRLLACRLIPLKKPNGGIRPIAIGETLGKLASCYSLSLCMKSDSYRKLFPTIQEGVGISGGCENVIHFVRTARKVMGKDSIVITVDFKNAYNMRKRIDMWNHILKHRSDSRGSGVDLSYIIRYFHWAYSVPSPLVLDQSNNKNNNNGPLITLQSSEGVRQGANESSLLFSLSMQSLYEKSLEGISVKNVQAKAIQDDFTIVGKPADALAVFKKIIQLANEHGMEVQPKKCCVLPPAEIDMNDNARNVINDLKQLGVNDNTNNLLFLLGAAISRDDDIENTSSLTTDWAENICLNQNERFFRLLTHRDMPAQLAFRLLIQSGLPRIAYLCRILPPSSLNDATHQFDKLIINTMYKILDIKCKNPYDRKHNKFSQQMQLKMKKGGLGLTSYNETAPAAYIASLVNAAPILHTLFAELGEYNELVIEGKRRYEKLYRNIRNRIIKHCNNDSSDIDQLLPSTKEEFDNITLSPINNNRPSPTHPSPLLYESSNIDLIRHLQSKLATVIQNKKAERYHTTIANNDRARLLSASQPSASIWLNTIPEENALQLSNTDFCAAIRHRLAIPSQQKCCQCNTSIGIVNDSQHPHICQLLKKEEVHQRHEGIVYTIRQLCDLAGIQSRTTVNYLKYTDQENDIVPDLYIYINGRAYMIDVSIVYPAGDTCVHSHKSNTEPLSSAIHRGKEKVRKYDGLARRNGMKFVPFILESFGAIGNEARSLIQLIAEQTNDPQLFTIYCIRRLSIALQRGNALIQNRGMKRLLMDQSATVNDYRRHVPNIVYRHFDSDSDERANDISDSEESDYNDNNELENKEESTVEEQNNSNELVEENPPTTTLSREVIEEKYNTPSPPSSPLPSLSFTTPVNANIPRPIPPPIPLPPPIISSILPTSNTVRPMASACPSRPSIVSSLFINPPPINSTPAIVLCRNSDVFSSIR